ncbi:MAG: radical SAM protein [Planctomycetota bacterium]
MKVILADPPHEEQRYDLAYPTIGILYLIGYARHRLPDKGYEFHYLEGFCSLDEHIEKVRKAAPDLYGISFTSRTAHLAYRVINRLRQASPALPIVCGGAHPTAAWEDVLEHSKADICVIGEGEQTFVELLEHFRTKKGGLSDIPGIAYREEGQAVRTEKRSLIADLDSIPFPAWDHVNFGDYLGIHIRKAYPQTYMLVSRGCPFDCNFCSNPVWKENKPWVRKRSGANIAQETKLLYDRGIREIYMSADEFNLTHDWTEEVCTEIQKLGLSDLYFQCNIRADRMSPEMARQMAAAKIWMVHLGIESGNQRTLNGIQKKVTLEQIENACRIFQAAGIKIFGFLMLFHVWEENGALRWESPRDVDKTLDFAKHLFKNKLIDYMSWQMATPNPGSRLWDIALRHNLLLDPHEFRSYRTVSMKLPGVTPRHVRRALRRGLFIKNWYALKNGNINWRHLDRVWENIKSFAGFSS